MKQFFEWFDFVRPPWGKAVAEFISGSVLMASLVVPVHSERWTGQVSALDGHRLAVIRTGQFTSSRKSPAEVTLLRHRSTVFGSAVSLKDPLQAKVFKFMPIMFTFFFNIITKMETIIYILLEEKTNSPCSSIMLFS